MTAAEASVTAAHVLLQSAREALDEAVKALPGIEGDKTMATPGLVALLVRVSTAKSHLNGLELILAAEVAAADIRNARHP
jgi:hypothetical protein